MVRWRVSRRERRRGVGARRAVGPQAGMTLIEVLVAMAIVTVMMLSVWNSFSATMTATKMTEDIQERYAAIRNSICE